MTGQHLQILTVASREKNLVVQSLTYMEPTKKDEMDEEANLFVLYSSSLRVATDIKT